MLLDLGVQVSKGHMEVAFFRHSIVSANSTRDLVEVLETIAKNLSMFKKLDS